MEANQPPPKPKILYAVPPREGHMRPALQISAHLVEHGYNVTMLGTDRWRDAIEAVGAIYSPCIGLWAVALDDPSWWPTIVAAPTSAARNAASLDEGFTTLLPSGFQSVCTALAGIVGRDWATERIVVLSDTCFSGTLPLKLKTHLPPGCGLEKVKIKTIGIGVVPVYWAAAERPPWGSGLPYDDSEEGKTRTLQAHQDAWNQEAEDRARKCLLMMACAEKVDALLEPFNDATTGLRHPFWDASTVCHDVTLQMGLRGLEFPTPSWPAHLKFAGPLPPKELPSGLKYPEWWDELVFKNSAAYSIGHECGRKKVVFVAQGTEVLDHNELIVPTVQALAGRDDVVVIVVLCVKGATLNADSFANGELPANCHVLDYFPYDAILPHADVFLSSSGYGGLTHAVAHAVPLVQTGRFFDKPDIGRRVEWSGMGIYLADPTGAAPPSAVEVGEAVDKVLGDAKFRRRAGELRDEALRSDPLASVEMEVAGLSWD
ncbi:hypothetical protein PspLS_10527 [Pyricularia sp. CBS 133598]|nr:hypothetical protein PspLS_10527 [Pyricularia sp. CBS 133598]